jgi:Na+/H+ antiporter NhaD/arsenite permease-like protein
MTVRWWTLASLIAVGLLLLLALGTAALPWILPEQDEAARHLAAIVIFAASYLALAIGKVPGLSIDRAGVALVGACLMVVSGVVSLQQAYQAIDPATITLLLGMMIVVANLRISGFFALVNAWVTRRVHRPLLQQFQMPCR